MVNETPNMIPWWILPMIAQEPQTSGIDLPLLVTSLNRQLRNWSHHIGIIRVESGKWWHIEPFSAEPAKTPEELLNNLGGYFFNPLQRGSSSPPRISGDIDASRLHIALVGSVCDKTTRAYLYCLGKLLRWRSQSIFGPRSLRVFACLYLPQDTHQRKDRKEISRFLWELESLMEQTSEHRPFDAVFFSQDSNYSFNNNSTGYQSLSPSQLTELLVQNLFHLMIGESKYLNEQMTSDQPCYMAFGSVALYYDLQQHRQKLALQAGTTLLHKFSVAKAYPFVNNTEAEAVVERIGPEISSQTLLAQLNQITQQYEVLRQSDIEREEDPYLERVAGTSSHLEERLEYIYWNLLKRTDAFWSDDQSIGKVTLIKGVREIFAGRYGQGSARSLEQALWVLKKLRTRYTDEDYQAAIEQLKDPVWWANSGLEDFLRPTLKQDLNREQGIDPNLSLIIPLPLLQLGFEIALLAGLATVLGSTGYLLYRRLKNSLKDMHKQIDDLNKNYNQPQPALISFENDSLRKEVRQRFEPVFEGFYHKAQQLFEHLEVYITNVQETLKHIKPKTTLDDAYAPTSFFRSVLDDWTVPGRTASTRLMSIDLVSIDSFAPELFVNERLIRFAECGERDLHFLVNQLFEKNSGASDLLIPAEFEPVDENAPSSRETARETAENVAGVFGRYGRQLYESMSFSMDDALKHVSEHIGKRKFLELIKHMAAPPLIVSAASMALVPLHFEWKYQNIDLLRDMMKGAVVEQVSNVEEEYSPTLKGDLLSVAIYQPIRLSGSGEASLNSIHTLSELKNTTPASEYVGRGAQAAASPSFVLTMAVSPEDALPIEYLGRTGLKEVRALKEFLSHNDLWQTGRRETNPDPDFMQEESGLELHLKVTFDEQINPNRLTVGEPVKLRIAPSKHFNEQNSGRAAPEPKFQVNEADVMLWTTKADLEPSWQTLKLNEPLDTPLIFKVTPKVEGKLALSIMILVRNEPVYESEINCEVFSRPVIEGKKETIHLGPQPEYELAVPSIDKDDEPLVYDDNKMQEDE